MVLYRKRHIDQIKDIDGSKAVNFPPYFCGYQVVIQYKRLDHGDMCFGGVSGDKRHNT